MRRRKGLSGAIFSLIGGLIMLGLIVAVLRQFDYDVVAAGEWLFTSLADIANKIADKFTEMPGFRNVFS